MQNIEENYTKAMKEFVKLAAQWGAKPVQTTGKHLKFRDALGNQISAPKTSSDFRAIRNFKSELKNRGFVQQLPKVKDKGINPTQPPKPIQTPPTRETANQQTTFKDFMNKVRPMITDIRRPETLAARMERGWRQSIKDLPLKIKAEMGDKIIRQLAREENIPRIVRGVSYGLKYGGKHPIPFVTTHPAFSLLRNKTKQVMPSSATPVIGIGAGKALYDYVLKPLAQQRRKEQEERRTQLIPSGNYPYGTGRVAKVTEEYLDEKLIPQLIKGAARQLLKTKGLQQKVKSALPLQQPKVLSLPRQVTGFQTARGSTYTLSQKPNSWAQTQRTAPNDPFHPTAAGTKQKSDWTLFTTPAGGARMKTRWNQGVSRTEFFKGEPVSPKPKVGRAPVEVWNQYQGGGRAMHWGNPITDVKSASTSGSNVPLYGSQRRELSQRVSTSLRNPSNRQVLRREIQSGQDASINNLYKQRTNPKDPMSVEDMLRNFYRQK